MMESIIILVHVLISISGSCINYLDDPCSPTVYTALNEYTRSAAYHDSSSSIQSDATILEGWYRSTSAGGEDMPMHAPKNGYCQALYPAWLRGSVPGVAEGIVERTVCVRIFRSKCSQTIKICVKNCVNFNVYYLYRPTDVSFRYCFGNELPCQRGFRSPNGFTPGCQETIPDVNTPALCYSATNPCDANNHKIWDDPTRNAKHPFISQAEDSQLIEGWYRAIEPAGIDMSTKSLGPLECQSFSPIWLNGTVPNVGDGIVKRPACVQKVLDSNECAEILQICMKNCGQFNTYFLLRPTGTFGRYCFASAVTTLPPDSTSQSTTTRTNYVTSTIQATTTTTHSTAATTLLTTTTSQSMGSTKTQNSVDIPLENTTGINRPSSTTVNENKAVRTETPDNTHMYLIIIGVLVATLVLGTVIVMIVGCSCYNKNKAKQPSLLNYLKSKTQNKPQLVSKHESTVIPPKAVHNSYAGPSVYNVPDDNMSRPSSFSSKYYDIDDMKNGKVYQEEDCKYYDGSEYYYSDTYAWHSNVYEKMAKERDDHNYQPISAVKNESAAAKQIKQTSFTADGDAEYSEIPADHATH